MQLLMHKEKYKQFKMCFLFYPTYKPTAISNGFPKKGHAGGKWLTNNTKQFKDNQ